MAKMPKKLKGGLDFEAANVLKAPKKTDAKGIADFKEMGQAFSGAEGEFSTMGIVQAPKADVRDLAQAQKMAEILGVDQSLLTLRGGIPDVVSDRVRRRTGMLLDWLRAPFQNQQPEGIGGPSQNWLREKFGDQYANTVKSKYAELFPAADEEVRSGIAASLGAAYTKLREKGIQAQLKDKKKGRGGILGVQDLVSPGFQRWDSSISTMMGEIANHSLVTKPSPMVPAIDALMEAAGIPDKIGNSPLRRQIAESYWHALQESFWVSNRPFDTKMRVHSVQSGNARASRSMLSRKSAMTVDVDSLFQRPPTVELRQVPNEALDYMHQSSKMLPTIFENRLGAVDFIDDMLRVMAPGNPELRQKWAKFASKNPESPTAYSDVMAKLSGILGEVKSLPNAGKHRLFNGELKPDGTMAYSENTGALAGVAWNAYENLRFAGGLNAIKPNMSRDRVKMLIDAGLAADIIMDPKTGKIRDSLIPHLPPYAGMEYKATDAARMMKFAAEAADSGSTLAQQKLANSLANTVNSPDPAIKGWFSEIYKIIEGPGGLRDVAESTGSPIRLKELSDAVAKNLVANLADMDLQTVGPMLKQMSNAGSGRRGVVSEWLREMYGQDSRIFVLPNKIDRDQAFHIAVKGRQAPDTPAIPRGEYVTSTLQFGDAAEEAFSKAIAEADFSEMALRDKMSGEQRRKFTDVHPSDEDLDKAIDLKVVSGVPQSSYAALFNRGSELKMRAPAKFGKTQHSEKPADWESKFADLHFEAGLMAGPPKQSRYESPETPIPQPPTKHKATAGTGEEAGTGVPVPNYKEFVESELLKKRRMAQKANYERLIPKMEREMERKRRKKERKEKKDKRPSSETREWER